MYTTEQFFADVTAEAAAIKQHATPEEIAKLNLNIFDPGSPTSCIYGQMTGHCKTTRASDLIYACCPRYFINAYFAPSSRGGMQAAVDAVNGSAIEGVYDGKTFLTIGRGASSMYTEQLKHLSAIEVYIMCEGAKNGNLIDFIKGDVDTLEL